MSFVALIILILISFFKLKLEGGLKFTLMTGSFVAFLITLLKYSNAALSVGTLVGILFAIGLVTLLSWKIISEKDEDANELNYKKFRNLSFATILLTIFLSVMVKGVSMFYDFSGVLLLSSLILVFMNMFVFKTFNYLSIKRSKNV